MRAVRLVELVAPAQARARRQHGLLLGGRVPDVEVLVDELLEDAVLQPYAWSEDARRLEALGDAEQDRRSRNDRVGAEQRRDVDLGHD